MRKVFTIIFFLLSIVRSLVSQDVQFSQFFAAPLYLSPSFAGTTEGSRVAFNFRDQWDKFPKTFISTVFSYDHSFRNINTGLGFLMVGDRAGDGNLMTLNLGLVYSYDIKVTTDFHIRPGINFQFGQTGINLADLFDITNMGSGGSVYGSPSYLAFEKVTYFDFTFSLLAYSNIFWGGITFDHLFRPTEGLVTLEADTRVPIKTSVYGGGRVFSRIDPRSKRREDVSLVILYKTQSTFNQAELGVYWERTPMIFGIHYRGIPFGGELRGSDALVFIGGYKIEDLSIGYSYDYVLSSLRAAGGSHEISVVYTFNKAPKRKKKKWAPVPCPTF